VRRDAGEGGALVTDATPGPEMRYDLLQDTWVLLAADRKHRPHDYRPPAEEVGGPETCPFEPGQERQTPPEVFALRAPDSFPDGPGWRVRVIPNKYPALRPNIPPVHREEGMHRALGGFGYHEVVVDTPHHTRHADVWTRDEWRDWLEVLRNRVTTLSRDSRVEYVQVFKNHGRAAGASRAHPHTQILALPLVPKEVRVRLRQMQAYYQAHAACYLCQEALWEHEQGKRIVYENDAFIVYCPFASRFPFEMRIVPKMHHHAFHALSDALLDPLGNALQVALRALHRVLEHPPFNLLLHTAPPEHALSTFDHPVPVATYGHWYMEILPRLGVIAGFEFGTGYYINAVPPEQAASLLRP